MERQDRQVEQVQSELKQRQRHVRAPQRFGDILSNLLARRGYAQQQSTADCAAAWAEAAGGLAAQSRAGLLRSGVLEIMVENSVVLQELTFQKARILKRLQEIIPNHKIRDLRFRVGGR